MVEQPTMDVVCDNCSEIITLYLNRSGRSWAVPDVTLELATRGWTMVGDYTYCDSCKDAARKQGARVKNPKRAKAK